MQVVFSIGSLQNNISLSIIQKGTQEHIRNPVRYAWHMQIYVIQEL